MVETVRVLTLREENMMRDKEFFPLTYISNLKECDPELAEILGNFISQDVSLQVNLDCPTGSKPV